MDGTVGRFICDLVVGEALSFGNLVEVPLFAPRHRGIDHLTLGEALERGALTVREASEGGSVPELRVANECERPVLILEGEELSGAKQNRVLNASVLVAPNTEQPVPVSCVERGRWRCVSAAFAESGNVLPHNVRGMASRNVADSLRRGSSFSAGQGAIWSAVDGLAASTGVSSQTSAMRDVYEGRRAELDDYVRALAPAPSQRGALFLVNGEVAGLDVLSNAGAFARLFPKLVRAAAMEAVARRGDAEREEAARRDEELALEARLWDVPCGLLRHVLGVAAPRGCEANAACRDFPCRRLQEALVADGGPLAGLALAGEDPGDPSLECEYGWDVRGSRRDQDRLRYLAMEAVLRLSQGELAALGEATGCAEYLGALARRRELEAGRLRRAGRPAAAADPADAGRRFLRSVLAAGGTRAPSPGLGWDWRFEGPGLVGAALVHGRTVLHASFFRAPAAGAVA